MMTRQVHGTPGKFPEAENQCRRGAQQRGRESHPLDRPGAGSTVAFTSWRFVSLFRGGEEEVGTRVLPRITFRFRDTHQLNWWGAFIGCCSTRPKTPRIYFFDERS